MPYHRTLFLFSVLFHFKCPCSLMHAHSISLFLSITLRYGLPRLPDQLTNHSTDLSFHCSLFPSIIVQSSLDHTQDTYVLVYMFHLLISYLLYIDIATVKSPQPQLKTYKYLMYVARNAKQALGLSSGNTSSFNASLNPQTKSSSALAKPLKELRLPTYKQPLSGIATTSGKPDNKSSCFTSART